MPLMSAGEVVLQGHGRRVILEGDQPLSAQLEVAQALAEPNSSHTVVEVARLILVGSDLPGARGVDEAHLPPCFAQASP